MRLGLDQHALNVLALVPRSSHIRSVRSRSDKNC
jgi:hypothetical protein